MDKLIVGCGYLGSRVAALWREPGQRVFATTRRPTGARELQKLGLEPIVCDVLDPASLTRLPPVDTLLYCVGFDRSSGVSMRSVYVEGLANVLRTVPRPRRWISVSSTSVYGQADEEWVDESSPTEPQEESGRIVLEAEQVLRERCPEAIVLRFAGIYGPGRLLRQKTIQAGEPIVGDASKWLNLIHVDDGAQAVLCAEERGRPGETYILCDGQPVRRREFYEEMARVLEAPPPRFELPPPGTPTPPHEKGNRRLRNRRFLEELQPKLRYPEYRSGLRQSADFAHSARQAPNS